MLRASSSIGGVLLLAACSATSPPREKQPPSATSATANRAASPTDGAAPSAPDDAGQALVIQQHEARAGSLTWSTMTETCRVDLTIEAHRMAWRSEPLSGERSPACAILSPTLRAAWTALAGRARQRGPLPRELSLTVDFRGEEESVSRWFRYQVEHPELRERWVKLPEVAFYAELAKHMASSGALARFGELLDAMGFALGDVSVEKVESLTTDDWQRALPFTKPWSLPPKLRLALPNGTIVKLTAK